MEERLAYIGLNGIGEIGPVRVRRMMDMFGSAAAIYNVPEKDLCRVQGIGPETAKAVVRGLRSFDPVAEEEKAVRWGARIITRADADYPASLSDIHDPPLALYVWGAITESDRHGLGVVGTRNPTHYGISMADRLSYGACRAGWTIVSGLARGIDTAAHEAALKAGGRTLAVLGSALDTLYPRENEKLAERIAGQGAVISEYPLGRKPDKTTFPYRNRIVAGLSRALLVVEAGLQSGAVITANQAMEQGRSVFAVPGRVDTPVSRGCHRLIRDGAVLCESLDDILEEMEFLVPPRAAEKTAEMKAGPDVPLNEQEQNVVKVLWDGPRDIDSLARESGLGSAGLNALLLGLEIKRVIQVLPGRRVELRSDILAGSR